MTVAAVASATRNQVDDPERILHPLRRAGKRGEGKWARVSWEEALVLLNYDMVIMTQHRRPLDAKPSEAQLPTWKGELRCDDQRPTLSLERKITSYGVLRAWSDAEGRWRHDLDGRRRGRDRAAGERDVGAGVARRRGREPDPVRAALAHVHQVPEPPSIRLGSPVPADLEQIVLQCLAKEREARPPSAAALASALLPASASAVAA